MTGWNFADLFEALADHQPELLAQRQAGRSTTWREFDRRADGVAAHLLAAGVAEQDKVAQYLYNAPEYLESCFGAFKAGLATVNTNYRYTADELVYLWDNADVVAVVFHGTFAERADEVRHRLPRIRSWLWVDDGSGDCPAWAAPYEEAATNPPGDRVAGPWGRDGDHLVLLYTGGTTGMPKGVMWRQDDLFRNIVGQMNPLVRNAEASDETVRQMVTVAGPVGMPACPLMHGTGLYTQLIVLSVGGSSVTLVSRKFDVVEMFDTIERERVHQIAIVGDAFGKPMLRALDERPGRWDLASLFLIASSGVMFSEPVKQGLLKHHPGMMLVDAFSSSEAVGMGQSISSGGSASQTATFQLGENTIVITEDGRRVEPGSGEIGRVAVGGHQPLGYYKDPDKTAATFIEFEGRRYSCPGDFAMVEADGSITLLGRGSVVINTGGEKVFPEEVEEAMKTFPGVRDAVAVAVPDEKFGEVVAAVVEVPPTESVDPAELIAHVRSKLAAYKAPKHIFVIDTIGRAPNGKVDYKRLKAFAADARGS